MARALRMVMRTLLVAVLVTVLTAGAGVVIARLSLPASACAVSEASIGTLVLERMREADVIVRLGCDGVRTVELDLQGLRMETVAWRGDAWPYARFEATLINGVLHGTRKVWLDLNVSRLKG
ncbi:MAG: hypothetical protein NW223_14975 [Hyphomicrobiaceae bacterium]|nr:hypothetical protein [Hyphomicrobiaceae bacterium]